MYTSRLFRVFLLFFSSLLIVASTAHAKYVVLLTGFEPFGGRFENSSQQAVEWLKESTLRGVHDSRGDFKGEIEYQVCILPVKYDRAAEKARECFEQLENPPDLVISTGEGDCTFRLETRAHNLDDAPGFPDNAGVIRVGQIIEHGAPDHEPLTLPIDSSFAAASSKSGPPDVRISNSPGYYVCNNTAFRLARYFKPQEIPYGFVHVPVGDQCGVKTSEIAERLDVVVRASLREIQ